MLKTFRTTVNDLRKPAPYRPVLTECKGVANITLGTMQLIANRCMKYSSNPAYRGPFADRHVVIGTAAIKQGLRELLPGAVVGMGVAFAAQNWTHS